MSTAMEIVQCSRCKFERNSAENRFCIRCGEELIRMDTSPGADPEGETAPGDETWTGEPSEDYAVTESHEPELNLQLEFKHLYLCAGKHGCIPFRLINVEKPPSGNCHLQWNQLPSATAANPSSLKEMLISY